MVATDSLGFLDAVCALPEQLADAHRVAGAVDADRFPSADGLRNIVVCGMGGSGISGDVLAAASNNELPVPVTVLRQIRVPRFVGPDSLVFAVSYSGSTDETLSMARHAIDAGARVVAIAKAGSPLARIVEKAGGLALPAIDGVPVPRAALGTLVAPIYVTLFRMGVLPSAHDALVTAQDQLARRRDACTADIDAPRNVAREVARKIGRTI